jgi:hypothetical protein
MQLIYSGAHPEVVVDELDSDQVIVRGEAVDVPDPLAVRLLEQDTWARAVAVKPPVTPPAPSQVTLPPLPVPVNTSTADNAADTATKGSN